MNAQPMQLAGPLSSSLTFHRRWFATRGLRLRYARRERPKPTFARSVTSLETNKILTRSKRASSKSILISSSVAATGRTTGNCADGLNNAEAISPLSRRRRHHRDALAHRWRT